MLHVLNTNAKCAKCGQEICEGTVVSWIQFTGRASPSGPHHIDCSPSKVDRDQALAEEAAGFSRLDLKGPPRIKSNIIDRPTVESSAPQDVLPNMHYKFKIELENDDRTQTLVSTTIAIAVLIIALKIEGLPYDFFGMLRLSVFAALALLAKQLWHCPKKYWRLILIGVAILYNPIFPVHLSKDSWEFFNVISLPILLVGQNIKQHYIRQEKKGN